MDKFKMNGIKKMREQAGMTQESLATILGVDPTTISKWESASSSPRAAMIIRLAELFKCSVADLF